jgi:hypothetical protein
MKKTLFFLLLAAFVACNDNGGEDQTAGDDPIDSTFEPVDSIGRRKVDSSCHLVDSIYVTGAGRVSTLYVDSLGQIKETD